MNLNGVNGTVAEPNTSDSPFDTKSRVRSAAIFQEAAEKTNQSKIFFTDKNSQEQNGRLLLLSEEVDYSYFNTDTQDNEDVFPGLNGAISDTVLFSEPTMDELTSACHIALKTYFHLRSFQSKGDSLKLLDYIEEVFEEVEDFSSIASKLAKEVNQERKLAIKCELMRGSGLPSKDLNGFSDPYCKMAILNKQHLESEIVKKHNIKEWIQEGLVKEEGMFQSTTKLKTLEPEWDHEAHEFSFTSPNEELLAIEVWDSDEESRLNKFAKPFQKIVSTKDDFMGRAFYPLTDIPTVGEERIIQLFSHSKDHKRGTLTIKLTLLDQADQTQQLSEDDKCSEFATITKVILAHESKKNSREFKRGWDGELSMVGSQLVNQCASLRNIPKIRESAVHFSLLMDYLKSYGLSVTAIKPYINTFIEFDSEITKLKVSSPPNWACTLLQQLQDLYTHVIHVLNCHLVAFGFQSSNDTETLQAYINTLQVISSSPVLLNELNTSDDFITTICKTMKTARESWCKEVLEKLQSKKTSLLNEAHYLYCLVDRCKKMSEKILNSLQPMFKQISVDYFTPFFYDMDQLLKAQCDEVLTDELIKKSDNGKILYRTFLELRELKQNYIKYVDTEFLQKQKSSGLFLNTYHDLFKANVPVWFELVESLTKDQLRHAVECDTFHHYIDKTPFSSSAFDTYNILLNVARFWKDLNWPDRDLSVAYFGITIQVLYDLATFYADLIKSKLSKEDFSNDGARFVISDGVCIALNNIQHVQMFVVDELSKELNLEEYYKFLDEGGSEHDFRKRAELLRKTVLELSVDLDIRQKKKWAVNAIHQRMIPTMVELTSEAFSKDENYDHGEAIQLMLDYIADNIKKLGDALLTPNLIFILEQLWSEVVQILKDSFDQLSKKKSRKSPLFLRLKLLALSSAAFFKGNGYGLSKEQIEIPLYKKILDDIKLADMPAEKVIRRFLKELIEQQSESSESPADYGVLHFGHLYNEKENTLRIDILSAENLSAMDRTGLSDPYVTVHLLPKDVFGIKPEKTQKKDQTVNPVFNTTITLSVDSQKLKEDGAIILLGVFDYDTFTTDDFEGLCVISTRSIPHGEKLKMEHLNLFLYKETIVYQELELRRSSDAMVNEFLKLMKSFSFNEQHLVKTKQITIAD